MKKNKCDDLIHPCGGIVTPTFLMEYIMDEKNSKEPMVKFAKTHTKAIQSKESNAGHNEFELAMRFLGNEIIAIKLAATNFSGKLIVWSIILLLMSFMIMEVFGVAEMLGYGMEE